MTSPFPTAKVMIPQATWASGRSRRIAGGRLPTRPIKLLRFLEKYNGNKPLAAKELGIALKTLYNKINQLQQT